MHHGPVDKEDKKIELRDRVLLGATWLREKQYFQSGASVGNVNVYDKILDNDNEENHRGRDVSQKSSNWLGNLKLENSRKCRNKDF